MKIYQDAGGGATTMSPHRHSHQRRKPLTPHNQQTPMQAFRQSLKDTTSKKQKSLVDEDKENQSISTPASLRRSLRGGDKSNSKEAALSSSSSVKKPRPKLLERRRLTVTSTVSTSLLGPPKRLPPKTPNSLLKSEFDLEDSYDESFLVSPPPGALWNVLGNSNKLVIVSPQAAAEIQQSLRKTKHATIEEDSLFSPPLKPRVLPTTTPKTMQKTPNKTEGTWFSLSHSDANSEKSPARTVSSNKETSHTPKTDQNGLVDFSDMFSSKTSPVHAKRDETTEAVATPMTLENGFLDFSDMFSSSSKKKKATPPSNVAKRLGRKTTSSPPGSNETKPLPVRKGSPQQVIEPTTDDNGLMDFSEMFSSKKKPLPPRGLAQRLQKPVASSTKEKTTNEKVSPPPESLPNEKTLQTKNQETLTLKTTNASECVEVTVDETGLLDFSEMFSSKKKTPPPEHAKRLQRRKSPKREGISAKNITLQKAKTQPLQTKKKVSATPVAAKAKEPVQATVNNNGLMDYSKVFSSTKKSPPKNLVDRLQRPKRSPHQKENKAKNTKSTVLGSGVVRPPVLKNTSNKRSMRKEKSRPTKPPSSNLAKASPSIQKPGKYAAMATPSSRRYAVMATPSSRQQFSQRKTEKTSIKGSGDGAADDWAEKQSETFVNWLNYTFHPTEDDDHSDTIDRTASPGCAGLRMLLIHRRLAQSRMKASNVFYGDVMQKAKNKIHSEIARGRLSIRSDRDLYYDLTLRRQVTNLLHSYTTPWLRLGLEVMFGECIQVDNSAHNPSKSHFSRMRSTLGSFIVNRVLTDSAVLTKYTKGKCKIPSGRFEKQFRAEMRSLVLYRIMVLVVFLDQAKTADVIDKVPRLFAKGSEVKSSRDFLLAFCRACLSSEGDFIKHLSRIGLTVSYKQDPVDELDFHVKNLATDLRDGTRLTRVTEIIAQLPSKSLMAKLRLPSISRLQKLHNLNLALSSLRDFGVLVPDDVNAHHVVDGHRDMVLKVMWSLIAHSCMEKLLEGDLVEQEIANVIRSTQARRKVHGLDAKDDLDLCRPLNLSDASPEEVLKSLLFRWCQAVCSSFDLKLDDFSTSFADGKALCLLIHYYHPAVIRLEEILPTSNDELEGLDFEQAIRNEQANSTMASRRASQLGGIPKMLPYCDTKNPPNEKSMLLCLTYLCSRLMESSKEIFATILIQECYRKYQQKVLLEKKQKASLRIFQFWCEHKEAYFQSQERCYARAVAILEGFVLTHKHSLKRLKRIRLENARRKLAATQIQRLFRGVKGREQFFMLWKRQQAAIDIQSFFRQYKARAVVQELFDRRNAASQIQKVFRGHHGRRIYLDVMESVVTVQRLARGIAARNEIGRQHHAAVVIQKSWWAFVDKWRMNWAATCIQSVWRGANARQDLDQMFLEGEAACIIQKSWRGFVQFVNYEITIESAIAIQHAVRRFLTRKQLRSNLAASTIQSAWRGFATQVSFQMDLMDIISVQNLVRKQIAQKERSRLQASVGILQGAVRSWLARRDTQNRLKERIAATTCQGAIRRWLAGRELMRRQVMHDSAAKIQSHWRKYFQRFAFEIERATAVYIQAFFRRELVRREINLWNESARTIQFQWSSYLHGVLYTNAAIELQRSWRSYLACKAFTKAREAAICIQKLWRGKMARDCLDKEHFAATILQSCWRRFQAQMNFDLDVLEIVFVQSAVRRFLAQQKASARLEAIQTIQNASRCALAVRKVGYLRQERVECETSFQASVIIQSLIRRYLAQRKFQRTSAAAVATQTWWRARMSMGAYHRVRAGVILFQAQIRGGKQRENISILNETASIIQSQWRSFAYCIKFRLMVGDVITVQSVVRRHLALQSIRAQSMAAKTIQSAFRGHVVRSSLDVYCHHASVIQAAFRGCLARIYFSMDITDIVSVQSVARRWLTRRAVVRKHSSLITVQTMVRRWLACRQAASLRREGEKGRVENSMASKIQSVWRGTRGRQIASEHAAARKIQKTWRCFVTHIDYLVQVMSVLTMQACVRRFVAQTQYQKKCVGLIKIQSFFRGIAARKQLKKAENAALVIQSRYRSYLDQSLFLYEKHSAITIQRVTRGFLTRVNFEIEHFAAAEIQKIWRGYDQFANYVCTIFAVIKIQSVFRRCLAVKKYEDLQLELWAGQCFVNKKAVVIQKAFRMHLYREEMSRAATIIQLAFRQYLARWRANMLSRATIRLQAAFRGRGVRRKRSRPVTIVARKLHRANMQAIENPNQRLGCRTSEALNVLQTSTSLSEIMDAVKTLESSTRLSVNCCEVFTNANAAKILLDLIRACNRSLPHVELVHWILLTLENVGQHKDFLTSFSDPASAEVFLDKVQMFRDKDGIFCLSVSLLRRVIHNEQTVLEFCGTHEHLKRLKGIYKLSMRRARPASVRHSKNKKRNWQRFYERKEVFDRVEALKTLGKVIRYIEMPVGTPVSQKHFTF